MSEAIAFKLVDVTEVHPGLRLITIDTHPESLKDHSLYAFHKSVQSSDQGETGIKAEVIFIFILDSGSGDIRSKM